MPVDVSEDAIAWAMPGWSRSTPARGARDRRRLRPKPPGPAAPGRSAAVAFLGGTIGNFEPEHRAAFLPRRRPRSSRVTRCCSAPTWSRTPTGWCGPTTTRRGHRRVQPQRAARDQPRARRRLRRGRLRARRGLGRRPGVDRDAAPRGRASTSRCGRSDGVSTSPRTRRYAPRSRRSSAARQSMQELIAAGLRPSGWWTDDAGSFGLSLAHR